MLKNAIQPPINNLATNTISNSTTPLGDGFTSMGPIVIKINMGVLSNVPFGSGYGYSHGNLLNQSNVTGGSNPRPPTLNIHELTFTHPAIADYSQYGFTACRIEIDRLSRTQAEHPTSNWLSKVTVDDGAGNVDVLDMSSGFTRGNWNTGQYSGTFGAYYSKFLGMMATGLLDTTNNAKTVTWEFIDK